MGKWKEKTEEEYERETGDREAKAEREGGEEDKQGFVMAGLVSMIDFITPSSYAES